MKSGIFHTKEARDTEIVKLFEKGNTIKEIASICGVSIDIVRRIINKNKECEISLKRLLSLVNAQEKRIRDLEIKVMYSLAGKSMTQIAKEKGISKARVSQILNNA